MCVTLDFLCYSGYPFVVVSSHEGSPWIPVPAMVFVGMLLKKHRFAEDVLLRSY